MLSREDGINEVAGMTTVKDAAKILKVSTRRVHQFIEDGRLRATPINPRMYMLDVNEVKKLASIPRKTGGAGHHGKKKRKAG